VVISPEPTSSIIALSIICVSKKFNIFINYESFQDEFQAYDSFQEGFYVYF